MRCYSIRKKLVRYADGEGKAPEREAISMHLGTCSSCRHELDEIQSLNNMLSNTQLPEVPTHIHERIMFEIKNTRQKKQVHRGLRWNLVPVAASLVLSLYCGILFGAKTLPLTVARTEISSLEMDQQTMFTEDVDQETSNE
jgi:predicted anti-sigma-YlaC factor YlaD